MDFEGLDFDWILIKNFFSLSSLQQLKIFRNDSIKDLPNILNDIVLIDSILHIDDYRVLEESWLFTTIFGKLLNSIDRLFNSYHNCDNQLIEIFYLSQLPGLRIIGTNCTSSGLLRTSWILYTVDGAGACWQRGGEGPLSLRHTSNRWSRGGGLDLPNNSYMTDFLLLTSFIK